MEDNHDINALASPNIHANNQRGWNSTNEQLAIDWGEKSKVLTWLHSYESKWYMRVHFNVGIVSIILATYAGAAAFINVDCGTELAYSVGTAGLTAAMLNGIKKFLEINERSMKHSEISQEYKSLSELIEFELSHYRHEREHAKIFINKIREKYNKLTLHGPPINDNAIEAFKKHFKNVDIAMPDIAANTMNPIIPIIEINSNNNIKHESVDDKV